MQQIALDFTSGSRLNQKHLSGQNKTIFTHLEKGQTITSHEAWGKYGITALHSRISDLRNKVGIIIYDRFVTRNGVNVKEYSLKPLSKMK